MCAGEDLLDDRLRVFLGPDHTDTLTTRYNLAHWRAGADEPSSEASVKRQRFVIILDD